MPAIRPISAITFTPAADGRVSSRIAPPYDVLGQADKDRLLAADGHNIVKIDLPHLPAKTVGPDATYEQAGRTYRQWLGSGVLVRRGRPAMFAYQQTYTAGGRRFQRRGLIANVAVQPFGPGPGGAGGIFPHEQTFSGPKEDRLKLMRATAAQLSPIFGLHSDPANHVHGLLSAVIDGAKPDFWGDTPGDAVRHEVWAIEDEPQIKAFQAALEAKDIFIADGHHRYTTALNYRQELAAKNKPPGIIPGAVPGAEMVPGADFCLFVLIAMQDPGMIILPTHRVLGGMAGLTLATLGQSAGGRLKLTSFPGSGSAADLARLQAALPAAGPHAVGVYCPADGPAPLAIATTAPDPLAADFPGKSPAWRQLDVAIVQHLVVERICQPNFCPAGQSVQWKFPHTLEEFRADTLAPGSQLGLLLQPTPLDSVRLISQAGELMPQKSTFFYPKLATGLVMNPLD